MTVLWVRADGSARLGLGHLMRTLALAEEGVRAGLHVHYVVGGDDVGPGVVREHGFDVQALPGSDDRAWLLAVTDGDLVVFDGYRFGPADFDHAAARGARVLAIDDLNCGDFPVDVLLNPNLPPEVRARTGDRTVILAGPRYALVRGEFTCRRRLRHGGLHTLLVTFGGSDVAGMTSKTVAALGPASPFEEVVVLLGPAVADVPALEHRPGRLQVRRTSDVAAAFDAADAVISAAGSTTWELLCMGLPTALVQVADNQEHIGAPVADRGAALFLGVAEEALGRIPAAVQQLGDAGVQQRLSAAALDLVDGNGGARVLRALLNARGTHEEDLSR